MQTEMIHYPSIFQGWAGGLVTCRLIGGTILLIMINTFQLKNLIQVIMNIEEFHFTAIYPVC